MPKHIFGKYRTHFLSPCNASASRRYVRNDARPRRRIVATPPRRPGFRNETQPPAIPKLLRRFRTTQAFPAAAKPKTGNIRKNRKKRFFSAHFLTPDAPRIAAPRLKRLPIRLDFSIFASTFECRFGARRFLKCISAFFGFARIKFAYLSIICIFCSSR